MYENRLLDKTSGNLDENCSKSLACAIPLKSESLNWEQKEDRACCAIVIAKFLGSWWSWNIQHKIPLFESVANANPTGLLIPLINQCFIFIFLFLYFFYFFYFYIFIFYFIVHWLIDFINKIK